MPLEKYTPKGIPYRLENKNVPYLLFTNLTIIFPFLYSCRVLGRDTQKINCKVEESQLKNWGRGAAVKSSFSGPLSTHTSPVRNLSNLSVEHSLKTTALNYPFYLNPIRIPFLIYRETFMSFKYFPPSPPVYQFQQSRSHLFRNLCHF